MAKQATVALEAFTGSPDSLLSDERIVRSIVFVRNTMCGNVLLETYRTREDGKNGHVFRVTDLLDCNQYLVEPIESGYRLFFRVNGGEVIVELASEADLPTIAQELGRQFAESDAQTF
jgi:hypothetical protein